jgi:hypothetical protein
VRPLLLPPSQSQTVCATGDLYNAKIAGYANSCLPCAVHCFYASTYFCQQPRRWVPHCCECHPALQQTHAGTQQAACQAMNFRHPHMYVIEEATVAHEAHSSSGWSGTRSKACSLLLQYTWSMQCWLPELRSGAVPTTVQHYSMFSSVSTRHVARLPSCCCCCCCVPHRCQSSSAKSSASTTGTPRSFSSSIYIGLFVHSASDTPSFHQMLRLSRCCLMLLHNSSAASCVLVLPALLVYSSAICPVLAAENIDLAIICVR